VIENVFEIAWIPDRAGAGRTTDPPTMLITLVSTAP